MPDPTIFTTPSKKKAPVPRDLLQDLASPVGKEAWYREARDWQDQEGWGDTFKEVELSVRSPYKGYPDFSEEIKDKILQTFPGTEYHPFGETRTLMGGFILFDISPREVEKTLGRWGIKVRWGGRSTHKGSPQQAVGTILIPKSWSLENDPPESQALIDTMVEEV